MALFGYAMLIVAPSTSLAASSRRLSSLDAGEDGPATDEAVATAGTIYIGPTAAGEAVRILATAFSLEELTGASAPGPIVVGPADLDVPWIVAKLEAAYEAEFAVAVTNADVSDIDRLHDLMLHKGSAHPDAWVEQVELAAVRKAERPDGQPNYSSHLLLPRAGEEIPRTIKPRPGRGESAPRRLPKLFDQAGQDDDEADRSELRGLQRIFADTPELPALPPPDESPQQNLLQFAESYQFHAIEADKYGNAVQLINSVWAARSFTNSADLYYVLQEADYHAVNSVLPPFSFPIDEWTNSVTAVPSASSPTLIGPSPQTTMEATQDISSVNYTIGGSVGWNETQGLNASVSASVTISNEKITTIPPIDIINDADLTTGQTMWSYEVNDLPSQPETIDLFSQWIWSIPFADYEPSQTEFRFDSSASSTVGFQEIAIFHKSLISSFSAQMITSVPMPFGRTFALEPPVITGVSPSCVDTGEPFTIQGTGFYPSLVQAVLIGGTPVNQANVTALSDTRIEVIAPDTFSCLGTGCAVAVRTSEGTSNTNFNVVISSLCG